MDLATRTLGSRTFPLVLALSAACSSSNGASGGDAGGQDGARDATHHDAGSDSPKAHDGGTDAHAKPDAPATPLGVLQHHGDGTRAGLYIDPAFTKAAVPGLEALPGFSSATLTGAVYAQPLYLQKGVKGTDAVFVATEANNIYALNADTGAQLWVKNVGMPEQSSAFPTFDGQPCGSISPLGITSTPIIDLPSRSLLTCAATMNNGAGDFIVASLSIDDGSLQWSVDLGSIPGFSAFAQMQRGALAVVDGVLYVPFGGQAEGCAPFHGWVVSVPLAAPHKANGWHTGTEDASGAGMWGPSGAATDGTSVYVATASPDTFGISPVWADTHIEAVLRITPGPVFSGQTADFFTPSAWFEYGYNFSQLGSSGVVLFDQPASKPSQLAFAIGKTSDAYLVNRESLGGVGGEVAHLSSATLDWVEGAMAAYSTESSGYVAMNAPGATCPPGTDLSTLKIVAGSPPTLASGWCAVQGGQGSPIATASAASKDSVVWGLGTPGNGVVNAGQGTGKLRAFDGDTGALLVESAASMTDLQHWISPIVVDGRLYVAGSTHVYAFDLAGAKHPAPSSGDAGTTDAGPPASCLPPISPTQVDPCAAFGLACQPSQQSELGSCVAASDGDTCLPSVGCASGFQCVQRGTINVCEPPCTTTGDCSNIFSQCTPLAAGGSTCHGGDCGPAVDAGAYFAPCDAGTCVPAYAADGTQVGLCMASGPADAAAPSPCAAARADGGAFCPGTSFCFSGASNAACLPLCDYAAATFGVDAGGPVCGAGQTCVVLGFNLPFGACAQTCGTDGGAACTAPLTCQVWNELTNQSACLP